MKKFFRVVSHLFANIGIVVSVVYILFYALDRFVPAFPFEVNEDFFIVDYLYLIIPILCIVSGILMQIMTWTYPKTREQADAEYIARQKAKNPSAQLRSEADFDEDEVLDDFDEEDDTSVYTDNYYN